MSRFLTPAKIGLLALIELYTEAVVPNSSTIPVLSFILNQLLPSAYKSQRRDTKQLDTLPFILDLKSFETLLISHPAAAGLPGRSLWDHFLRKLWEIDSRDALHVFFATRGNLLARNKEDIKKDGEMGIPPPSEDMILLSRTSPFGSFIRRVKVEYERSKFGDGLSLWVAFGEWREESRTYWARRNGGLERWAGDRALSEGQEEWGLEATEMLEHITYGAYSTGNDNECGISTDDVEKLLEFQVEQMQSKYSTIIQVSF